MALTPRIRFQVLQRDGFTCRYCGGRPPAVKLHVDHIVPRAQGGSDDTENLIAACNVCNQGKAARVIMGIDQERRSDVAIDPLWDVTDSLSRMVDLLMSEWHTLDRLPDWLAEQVRILIVEGEDAVLRSGVVNSDSPWRDRMEEYRESQARHREWMAKHRDGKG